MPPASLASSSRRELPQQEVTPGPGDQATPSLSDSRDSSSSLSRDSQEMEIRRETPRGASVGKTTQKNNSSRSTPRAILNAGQRRSRPSPWRRYLESVVEAKIREHFEAQIGSGGAANMITAEEHDGTNKKSHDAASKNMEGAEEHEVERDLESGLHQAPDDPADENFEQATRRSIAGKEGTRDANDNSREAKLLKKRHGKEVKKSKKSMLAQEVLSWLMFEGPSSSSNQAQERRKAIKAKGKEREGSINDEPLSEHDDLVIAEVAISTRPPRTGEESARRPRRPSFEPLAPEIISRPRSSTLDPWLAKVSVYAGPKASRSPSLLRHDTWDEHAAGRAIAAPRTGGGARAGSCVS